MNHMVMMNDDCEYSLPGSFAGLPYNYSEGDGCVTCPSDIVNHTVTLRLTQPTYAVYGLSMSCNTCAGSLTVTVQMDDRPKRTVRAPPVMVQRTHLVYVIAKLSAMNFDIVNSEMYIFT